MLDGPLKVMSKACHHITLYSLDSSQACAARRVVFGGFRATFVCRRHALMVGGVCAVPSANTRAFCLAVFRAKSRGRRY